MCEEKKEKMTNVTKTKFLFCSVLKQTRTRDQL